MRVREELVSVTSFIRRTPQFHRAVSFFRATSQATWDRDRLFLLEAAVILALVHFGLRVLPFQTVRSLLHRWEAGSNRVPRLELAPRLVGAVDRASRRLGLTCLPRALTAHALLARRGIRTSLQIGVARVPGSPLEAHAWIERDGLVVLGELPDLSRFVKMPLSEKEGGQLSGSGRSRLI